MFSNECEYEYDLYEVKGIADRKEKRQARRKWNLRFLVGCLTSQQHATGSQGWICLGNCVCCHTEIEDADQTCCFTNSMLIVIPFLPVVVLYPKQDSALDHVTPGAEQDSF